MKDLVASPDIDRRLGWSIGRADSLARRKRLPHYRLPDGSIRFRWPEVASLIRRVPDLEREPQESGVSRG